MLDHRMTHEPRYAYHDNSFSSSFSVLLAFNRNGSHRGTGWLGLACLAWCGLFFGGALTVCGFGFGLVWFGSLRAERLE
jgi:hypothetical protein